MSESSAIAELDGLAGDNPLGFLAALGVLEVAHRHDPSIRLSWQGAIVPRAVLHGTHQDQVVRWVLADAEEMLESVVLAWPPDDPLPDVKVDGTLLHQWALEVAGQDGWIVDQWCGLLAENAFDRAGISKPTHLHFTAGQQRFLAMVRELGAALDEAAIVEAISGPWMYASTLPSLGWDAGSERVYALRGTNPATEARLGVPAADWLGFRGLSAYPTSAVSGRLVTTACDAPWKASAFRWPVWSGALTRDVARSLVSRRDVVGHRNGQETTLPPSVNAMWARQGLTHVYEARIQRTDQGGYGSFAPPTVLWDARPGR